MSNKHSIIVSNISVETVSNPQTEINRENVMFNAPSENSKDIFLVDNKLFGF